MEVNDLSPPPEHGILPTGSQSENMSTDPDSDEAQKDIEQAINNDDQEKISLTQNTSQTTIIDCAKENEAQPADEPCLNRSDSFMSDGKLSEHLMEKSFSTCSTLQANKSSVDMNESSKRKSVSSASEIKLEKVSETSSADTGIPSIEEDTNTRINSWLEAATNSVSTLEITDSPKESSEELATTTEEKSDSD